MLSCFITWNIYIYMFLLQRGRKKEKYFTNWFRFRFSAFHCQRSAGGGCKTKYKTWLMTWSKLDFQFDPNFQLFFKDKNVKKSSLCSSCSWWFKLYGLHRSCWVIAVTHYGATQNKWVIRSDRLKPYNPQVTCSLSAMSEPPHPSSANTFLPPHFITGLLWAV